MRAQSRALMPDDAHGDAAIAAPVAGGTDVAPGVDVYRPGRCGYRQTWEAMRRFTDQRDAATRDQIWLVEHPPVFTQGRAGRAEHLLRPSAIELVQSDRGGQVTYHGPGQLILYPLLDIKRRGLGVRALVSALENAVIDVLAQHHIEAAARPDAPGVYVDGAKIASLGLRIRRGSSYHGVAFNVDMDLTPFDDINPCGLTGMKMTQLRDLVAQRPDIEREADRLLAAFAAWLGDPELCEQAGEPEVLAHFSGSTGFTP